MFPPGFCRERGGATPGRSRGDWVGKSKKMAVFPLPLPSPFQSPSDGGSEWLYNSCLDAEEVFLCKSNPRGDFSSHCHVFPSNS